MPTFNQLIHAAKCGFAYDGRTDLFFRFVAINDRGYNVDVSKAEAIPSFLPVPTHVYLSEEVLQRLLVTSADLHRTIVEESNARRWRTLKLYLNEHGHVPMQPVVST